MGYCNSRSLQLGQRVAYFVLYCAQCVGSIYFMRWLISEGWNKNSPATSGLFFAAEIIAFVSSTLFLSSGLFILAKDKVNHYHECIDAESRDGMILAEGTEKTDSSEAVPSSESDDSSHSIPTVAVCVCRYREPIHDLIKTVECMDKIDYPSDKLQLYILDDGWFLNDIEKQTLQLHRLTALLGEGGEKQGFCTPPHSTIPPFDKTSKLTRADCATECTYLDFRNGDTEDAQNRPSVTLIARKKPAKSHYKAGNVNNFLYNYLPEAARQGKSSPDYMLILDHDMLPHEETISHAIQRLQEDKRLAFLQYPQRFYDLTGSDLLYAGNEIFFDGIQVNRTYVGLTSFAGTNAVWRMEALYRVGGFQYGSLTEDALTGQAAHMAGYSSSYSLREMAVGQSPQTVEDAMLQRMRWSQGAIEIALKLTGAFFQRKDPYNGHIPLPTDLVRAYDMKRNVPRPSFLKKLLIFLINFDLMIYPLYSIGFLLHAGVCLRYLMNTEAPIAPSEPLGILTHWLPLYAVKSLCQVCTFPQVSFHAQWNSQMAWAGYSLSTIVSVFKAFRSKMSRNLGSSWFNTGAKTKKVFHLQYGNTLIASVIYCAMLYRAFAFVFVDKTCRPWMSIGALLYGFVMLMHVHGWALQPFREQEEKPKTAQPSPSRFQWINTGGRRESYLHSEALEKAREHRRVHHSLNLSLIFIVGNVAMFSVILFFWASNTCDLVETGVTVTAVDKVEVPPPPLPAGVSFDAEFTAKNGELLLNGQHFSVKGANWFGFETTRNGPFGVVDRPQDAIMDTLVKEGINALRIPLAVESILSPSQHSPPEWSIDTSLNPHLNSTDYLEVLESFVDRSAAWGVFVLLDMHRLRNTQATDLLPYDDITPFSKVKMAWEVLATRFCDSWSVMGADLKNEPIDVTWGGGGEDDWLLLAEELTNTVASVCPKWLIFVEGSSYLEDNVNPLKTQFAPFGGMLATAGILPIQVPNREKLIYSPHTYGPGTLGESVLWSPANNLRQLLCSCKENLWADIRCWEDTVNSPEDFEILRNKSSALCKTLLPLPENTYPGNMAAAWDFLFGYLKEEGETIIVGEWGGTYVNPPATLYNLTAYDDPTQKDLTQEYETAWNDEFARYLVKKGFGSFYWSINPESDDTGGLLLDDWQSIDSAKQELLRQLPSTNPLSILDSEFDQGTLESCLQKTGAETMYRSDGSIRYESESVTYNSAFDNVGEPPKAITFPRTEPEVQEIILCAAEFKVKVCPRAGGHSYTADSSCSGVLLDVRHLRQIDRLDEQHFWVGSGVKIGQIATAMWEHGRLIPTGNHGGVGTGFFLGCGYGYLSRLHGLACDGVVAARIVVSSGEILDVWDGDESSDLMWALRGAGSGQFGVVTSLLLKTYPLPSHDAFISFRLAWQRNVSAQAVSVWQQWALSNTTSHNFTCRLTLWNPPDEGDDFASVQFEGVLVGGLSELERLLEVPIAELGQPIEDERELCDYSTLLAKLYGVEDGNVLQVRNPGAGYGGRRRSFLHKSHLMPALLDEAGIETLVRFTSEQLPGSLPYEAYLSLSPLGGHIATPSRPSAFDHNEALALVQYGGYWHHPAQKYSVVRHQRKFHRAMTAFWGSAAFYNYKDNNLDKWEEAYWGSSVSKLRDVKCKYDSLGMFSTAIQSIKPNSTCLQESSCFGA